MESMQGRRVLVVGGSRGLGLGVVQALVAEGAQVTVLARDGERLAEVASEWPVTTIQGDMVDGRVIERALASAAPEWLILNGGATPHMAPLPAQTWETFSRNWEVDVKAAFLWIRAVLAGGMARGGRVVVSSSGAGGGAAGLRRRVGRVRDIWLAAVAGGVARSAGFGLCADRTGGDGDPRLGLRRRSAGAGARFVRQHHGVGLDRGASAWRCGHPGHELAVDLLDQRAHRADPRHLGTAQDRGGSQRRRTDGSARNTVAASGSSGPGVGAAARSCGRLDHARSGRAGGRWRHVPGGLRPTLPPLPCPHGVAAAVCRRFAGRGPGGQRDAVRTVVRDPVRCPARFTCRQIPA